MKILSQSLAAFRNIERCSIYFVTKNKHKVLEANAVLSRYDIKVIQVKKDKHESKDDDILKTAKKNALMFAKKLKKKVIVEDTGFFFHAYKEFPGSHPRMMYNLLGYKGLLKLLEGEKNRKAEFRTVVAYSDGKKVKTFVGKLEGRITKKVYGKNKKVMPYERIFVPKDYKKPVALMSRILKNKISHRSKAFDKLGRYL